MKLLPKNHIHVSEREPDGSWEDCTWCSGIEFLRLAYKPGINATRKEAEALRADAGEKPTGGSNLSDLKRGIKRRYGLSTPDLISGFENLWKALKPGTVAVVQGSMGAFGPNHELSKWDRNFDGGHAVCVMRLDDTDRVWWCDPEAPKGTYDGRWIPKHWLRLFVDAFRGEHLVDYIKGEEPDPEPQPEEEDMPVLTKYLAGYTAKVRKDSNVRVGPRIKSDKVRTVGSAESVVLVGTVKGDVDPANGSDVWYVWWNKGRFEYTAEDNIKNVQPPAADTAGDELDAAKSDLAKAKSTIDQQSAIIAGLKTDLAVAQKSAALVDGLRQSIKGLLNG